MRRIKQGICVILISLMVLQLLAPIEEVKASSSNDTMTVKNNENGTITLKYNNKNNIKTKVLVKKGNTQYQYELKSGANTIKIPLTQGNGTYTIMICQLAKGTSYAVVAQKKVKQNMTPTGFDGIH